MWTMSLKTHIHIYGQFIFCTTKLTIVKCKKRTWMFNLVRELFKWISLSFQCPSDVSIRSEMNLNCSLEINTININTNTTTNSIISSRRHSVRGDKAALVPFAVASKLSTRNWKCSRWYEGECESGWFLMRFSFFSSFCQRMHPYLLDGSKLYQCLVRGPQFIGIICMLTICCINGSTLISIDSTSNKRCELLLLRLPWPLRGNFHFYIHHLSVVDNATDCVRSKSYLQKKKEFNVTCSVCTFIILLHIFVSRCSAQ